MRAFNLPGRRCAYKPASLRDIPVRAANHSYQGICSYVKQVHLQSLSSREVRTRKSDRWIATYGKRSDRQQHHSGIGQTARRNSLEAPRNTLLLHCTNDTYSCSHFILESIKDSLQKRWQKKVKRSNPLHSVVQVLPCP